MQTRAAGRVGRRTRVLSSSTAAVATVAVAAGLLAACGGSSAPTARAPAYEVTTASLSGLGRVLVDGQGLTLYMFVPDHQSASTCYGACAAQWPPLVLPKGVTSPKAGPGVGASRLGVTHRTGGQLQVTYNHWPLYRWIGDSGPGQATGQGLDSLGGLWYVLSPKGVPIR